jgi:hypothetical protein
MLCNFLQDKKADAPIFFKLELIVMVLKLEQPLNDSSPINNMESETITDFKSIQLVKALSAIAVTM